MGSPEDDIIDRLRRRLCARFLREADEEDRTFADDRACICWVVLGSRLFDQNWLEEFFPAHPPETAERSPRVKEPGGRVRGRTLRGWWGSLAAEVLAWGRQQPWARGGYGVEGLLGEAYVRAVELWGHSDESFALEVNAEGEVIHSTDSALEWMKAIVCRIAAARTKTREVTLTYEPAGRQEERLICDATATRLPDRQLMAQRVASLSAQLPVRVPDLPVRLGGRGTLQLLLVADQLAVALALPGHYLLQWCLQTLAGKLPKAVAEEMDTTPGNVATRFCRIRDRAQSDLAALWCQYVAPPPTPEGTPDE